MHWNVSFRRFYICTEIQVFLGYLFIVRSIIARWWEGNLLWLCSILGVLLVKKLLRVWIPCFFTVRWHYRCGVYLDNIEGCSFGVDVDHFGLVCGYNVGLYFCLVLIISNSSFKKKKKNLLRLGARALCGCLHWRNSRLFLLFSLQGSRRFLFENVTDYLSFHLHDLQALRGMLVFYPVSFFSLDFNYILLFLYKNII